MSDSQHIESIIRDYLDAVTAGPKQPLELAETVEVTGSMLPEPMHGTDAVSEYLQQIAPFIAQTEVLEIVIDRNSAAARVLIHGIQGVEIEGAFFFRIYQ